MSSSPKERTQYDNLIEICNGYQLNEPDVQLKVPHPHFIQHNVAIILRVWVHNYNRYNTNPKNLDTNSTTYVSPNYMSELKHPSAVFSPNKHSKILGVRPQTKPCLIEILPKLYEK